MKKILLPILLFVMFIPFEVGAKEYCKVVSGNGKDIGSEIACGTEHFYIIDSNEDEIKMLAKYNLYTGVTIDKIDIKKEAGDTRTDEEYCLALAQEKGGTLRRDGVYNVNGYCFIETRINADEIKQSSDAKSAHWDENENYLYPQVGDVYLFSGDSSSAHNSGHPEFANTEIESHTLDSSVTYEDEAFKDFIIDYSKNTIITKKLIAYQQTFSNLGIDIENIDLLSLDEINNIIYSKTNKKLPLLEWGDAIREIHTSPGLGGSTRYNTMATFGSLKGYIPDEYRWLYSTTYWNKTVFLNGNTYMGRYYVFVAEEGKLCGAGFGYCAPQTTLGCGIRPVVTIPNELQYLITTETDGNGTIEAIENSLGGETIQFKVSAKNGYKLGSIVIKTDSGEEVEFSEGEITKNDDGTFSIDKNKFTMPFESITIQAKFESESILKNPETGIKILFIIFTLVTSIVIGTFIYKKKESRYNV